MNDTFETDVGTEISIKERDEENCDNLQDVTVWKFNLHYFTVLKNVGILMLIFPTLLKADPKTIVIVYSVLTLISEL